MLDAVLLAQEFDSIPVFITSTEILGTPSCELSVVWMSRRLKSPRGSERAHQTVLPGERRQEPSEASREGTTNLLCPY